MGLFKRKLGEVVLLFKSASEVQIIDNLTNPNDVSEDIGRLYLRAFPFLFCAKFLYNFPPPGGQIAAENGLSRLESSLDFDHPERCNVSLLNVCSDHKIALVNSVANKKWTYKARLGVSSGLPDLKTKIDYGEEKTLHKASIDAVFEHSKMKFEDLFGDDEEARKNGGATFCTFVRAFLKLLVKDGVEDIGHSYSTAIAIAAGMLESVT